MTGNSVSMSGTQRSRSAREREDKRSVHIKKPLNAFMLYMKEMRPKIVAECTLKESAAINQILGRRVRYRVSQQVLDRNLAKKFSKTGERVYVLSKQYCSLFNLTNFLTEKINSNFAKMFQSKTCWNTM